jgi:uncharacterized protein with PIN domain
MDRAKEIRFAVESTLGKLAKWLRILGFDTFYDPDISRKRFFDSGKERILITRTEEIRDKNISRELIFITSNDPLEQLCEAIEALGIDPKDIRPFSRCIRCNTPIRPVDKDSIFGKVPDFIWETHDDFQFCNGCRRIYWPGSHTRQSHDIIKRLFLNAENKH